MGSQAEQQRKRARQLAICRACAAHIQETNDAPAEWWFDPEDAATWPDWFRETPMGRLQVPPLDLAFGMAGRRFAIEHSQIEGMPNQRHKLSILNRVFRPLAAELSGNLPKPGWYNLALEMERFTNEREARAAVPTLREWIRSCAPELRQKHERQRAEGVERAADSIVPFRVSLTRKFGWEKTKFEGVVHCWNYIQSEKDLPRLRRERRQRMTTNFRSNLPKLAGWTKAGFETGLVLDYDMGGVDGFDETAEDLLRDLHRRKRLPPFVFFTQTMMYGEGDAIRVGWLYILRWQGETIQAFEPWSKTDFYY